ncbi:MAG: ketoacyl-ACP synthase III, partial [Boseongicola sp. SB0667_bin_21]|nr:ketoacyl-ACP synthase III [Boseongicola sp. SB0667_bin_21]
MRTRAVVQGVGHYLPERVIPNSWFENKLDTSDEWIRARTGIESRHFAAEGETVSELATKAASSALAAAGRAADDVDVVIVATSTPDLTFPSAATIVQAKLGMKRGYAFDVQAVCAGFVFGLSQANALIVSGQARSVLLIGAETFSSILDWSDRTTCVLFGDGAGAVLLEVAECEGSSEDRGILATDLHSDGRHRDILYVDGGVSTQEIGHLRMQGREVFRHAVEKLAGTAQASLDSLKFTGADVDWLVPHQANLRIIKSTAQKLGLEMERVVLTVQ